ncbi:myosin-2 heavy chain-like isoform X1 [Iris pallida]|uniref:Myosin-2 heavy chain-like isoform X1 n=1 Tax=Iris pallida TaxID=29817 RepID=A0AAX6EDS3_IRIPA|nr:myosin-2 heavy chain-like isoform X1 [Iris pallida]
MAEENNGSSVDVEVKLAENKVDQKIDGGEREISIQGKGGSKELYEEETVSDGEFIKVEKEPGDVQETYTTNADSGTSEKIKSLEIQLENVSEKLRRSESERDLLKSEVALANEKFEKVHKDHLELQHRMQEEISASEEKYNLQHVSHQEALGTLDLKHKELADVKESFSVISAELESSRKKMKELEAELESSATNARRLDELSNERALHAEIESKRALEFERAVELAKQSAKKMEDQMGDVQEELKGLYNRIAEYQLVEETLSHTTSELSSLQEKLKLSESKVEELEQKLIFKEDVIQEVARDLDAYKASEEKMKGEMLEIENQLSTTKDELQSKLANLEEVALKHEQEVKAKETAEAGLRNQETQILSIQEELDKLAAEKETLQSVVADLNTNLALTKESCSQLEDKIAVSEQNFSKTDSLLSEALSSNAELEQKLKSLEELHGESRLVADNYTRRSLELEGLLQSSNAAEEEVRELLRETQTKLAAAEQQNVKLEEQVALAELKCNESDREIKSLYEKITEMSSSLAEVEEERALSKCHFQAYEDRVSQLEESLGKSSTRNSKLEEELKNLSEMHAEHVEQASVAHQRSVELEGLIHISSSKAEDTEKKVVELEVLLEAAKQKSQEFEQLLSISEAKCREAEMESNQLASRVSELSTELEAFQTKSESLEIVLHAANEKERDLTDTLNVVTEERKTFEDMFNTSSEKLSQAEKLIEVLQAELKTTQEKLESAEEQLKMSGVRENEILEKLVSAENQLEHHGRAAELASTRCLELESLHQSLLKDSELKFQESVESLTQKDSEVKQLDEKVKYLEEQTIVYQDQAVAATDEVALLKAELETSAATLVSLEKKVEELNRKVSEAEMKVEQSYSENEMLAGTNSELKRELEAHQGKINELNELLSSAHAEKEATAEQLSSHVKTLEELTNEHSRGLKLKSATESRIKETEDQLQEALERLTQSDSEVKDLKEKLFALDIELRSCREQLGDVTVLAENRKVELEEVLLKIQNLESLVHATESKAHQFETENESLASTNMVQLQKLANYETKVNELETALNAVISEKEETSVQLHSSKKTTEDLMQEFASDREKLQSQISSVMEENAMLNKTYQNAKEELDAVKIHVEELKERETSLSAEVENLKLEIRSMALAIAEKEVVLSSKQEEHLNIIREKDDLSEQIKKLEQDLIVARSMVAEQREMGSKMELEREAAIKQSSAVKDAESQRASLLEKQVEDLKQQLHIAEIQYKEKVAEEGKKFEDLNAEVDDLKQKLHQTEELKKTIGDLQNKLELERTKSSEQAMNSGVEVKSRDLGFEVSSPSKRKNKKKGEGVQAVAPVTTTASQPSGLMAFKFLLGVALVSVIVGIILGKKY